MPWLHLHVKPSRNSHEGNFPEKDWDPGGGGGHFHIDGDGDVPLDRVMILRSSPLTQDILIGLIRC